MTRLAAREAYRLWAQCYDETPNPLLALEERLLAAEIVEHASACQPSASSDPRGADSTRNAALQRTATLAVPVGRTIGGWSAAGPLAGLLPDCTPVAAFEVAGPGGPARTSRQSSALPERLHARGLVLDVGCGAGRWARLLPACRYFGVDLCPEMIRRPDCVVGDARALPVASGSAALTVCSFVLGYLPHMDAAIAELARATRPGGTVMASDLHPAAGWSRTFHSDGATYEIEQYAHSPAEVLHAAERAGLRLLREISAPFGEPERPVFRAAGREDLLDRAASTPALWAALWERQ